MSRAARIAPVVPANDVVTGATASGKSSRRRSLTKPDLAPESSLVPEGWRLIAPVMVAGYALPLSAHPQWPGPLAGCLLAGGALLAASAPSLVKLELLFRHSPWLRVAAMVLGTGLPMLAYGSALALGDLNPPLTIAALAIVSLLASIVLSARLPALIIAQVALWSPAALALGLVVVDAALVIGTALGAITAMRQLARDRYTRTTLMFQRRAQLRAEEILADYEQTGQGWFWETDRRGAIVYVSAPIGRLIGRDPAELIGRAFIELFVLDAASVEGERTLAFHLNARSSFADLPVRAATSSEERWWSISGRPLYDAYNNFCGFRGSGSDLTEKLRSEQQASRLAHYDSLTGLANRFQMSLSLEKILNAPNPHARACAVFLIDLDRFKQVNDTMGHPVGDALLKLVAERLSRCVDKAGRVGRLGGDEFEVILPGAPGRRDLGALAKRIIASLSEPYHIEGSQVVIGASVGIALSPDDGVTSEAIIRNADLALYAAKDRGRGVHHFYDADLHSDAEERRQLEADLRQALGGGGLELHYQPVVSVRDEQIVGFEALLRWQHPTRGWLSPARFVPIAEDTGLIAQIGEWALRTACHDLSRWPQSVRVSVNVSPLQFANPALPAIITNALAAAGVEPARLELELTESVFLNNDAGTHAMFASLKRLGVRLALDDFGTGYSALGYLRHAPFDKIKIDQSFVRGATVEGSRNGAIIASIVSLAEALGMETTAEGVETLAELDMIRELGCSHIQGFLYSQPMCRADIEARLAQGLTLPPGTPLLPASAALPEHQTLSLPARRRRRALRHLTDRQLPLDHAGASYAITIRNISRHGAMIEGLWNVPEGLQLDVCINAARHVPAVVRWSKEGRIGVEFTEALADGEELDTPEPTLTMPLRRVG